MLLLATRLRGYYTSGFLPECTYSARIIVQNCSAALAWKEKPHYVQVRPEKVLISLVCVLVTGGSSTSGKFLVIRRHDVPVETTAQLRLGT